jgi:type III pantothenate kinase
MSLLCLDIGNTSGHFSLISNGTVNERMDIPTKQLGDPESGIAKVFQEWDSLDGVSFCSVVPAATEVIKTYLQKFQTDLPAYHMQWNNIPDFGFDYPTPEEVGGDRLANSYGAMIRHGRPAIVVCMGTATVFDIITPKGYGGGIIGPGLALMADYLHEKTALLPKLDRLDLNTPLAWGKGTKEAMKIGCGRGYRGMIRALLEEVIGDMQRLGYESPKLLLTGGNAFLFNETLYEGVIKEPDLAAYGLYEAYLRVYSKL